MTDQCKSVQSDAVSGIAGSEAKKIGFSLYLKIPDNAMECRCSYVPQEQGSMMTGEELAGFLRQYNVREGIDQQVFDAFAAGAVAGQQQVDVLMASGLPPVAGADAYLVLSALPSTAVHSGDDAVTNVDLHIVQAFINVSAGDEIGRIVPAGLGTPGKNIMGVPVAPLPGKSLDLTIGKNIRTEENGALLIAAASGRLCQSAGEISVEEEYIVKGDVNFRVGSINFNGVVNVRGDVLDNFDIAATKGLTVTGNIGACGIVSAGDVTFCGMDGQNRGRIVCGGTLRAHFIHDVVVECAGDVIVDVEIHNCTIKTLGRIVVDKGAISGGSYIARGGIEARKLGSASSTHTELHAGVDYRDVATLESLYAALAETQSKSKQSLPPAEISELRKTTAALTDQIMAIRNNVDGAANAKINAKSVLYENVLVSLGSVTETIQEQNDGPLTIIENSIDGGFRHLSMTTLDVKAAAMEMVFVRDQKKSLH